MHPGQAAQLILLQAVLMVGPQLPPHRLDQLARLALACREHQLQVLSLSQHLMVGLQLHPQRLDQLARLILVQVRQPKFQAVLGCHQVLIL